MTFSELFCLYICMFCSILSLTLLCCLHINLRDGYYRTRPCNQESESDRHEYNSL